MRVSKDVRATSGLFDSLEVEKGTPTSRVLTETSYLSPASAVVNGPIYSGTATYIQVGNIVTVVWKGTIAQTASGSPSFTIDLPRLRDCFTTPATNPSLFVNGGTGPFTILLNQAASPSVPATADVSITTISAITGTLEFTFSYQTTTPFRV